MKTKNPYKVHRKIYERHYGSIPKEPNGRSYEIHHIDGNHNNNDPSNLIAVTLQKHYDIHYAQEDWAACRFMAIQRLSRTPEEISQLSKKTCRERVENGTHPFLGYNNPCHKMYADGTHPFLGGEIQRKHNKRRIEDGTHNLLGGDQQRIVNKKLLDAGEHIFQINNPNLLKVICPHCGKIGAKPGLKRWHFDNCKNK